MARKNGKDNFVDGWYRTVIYNGYLSKRECKRNKTFMGVGRLFEYKKEAKLHSKLRNAEKELNFGLGNEVCDGSSPHPGFKDWILGIPSTGFLRYHYKYWRPFLRLSSVKQKELSKELTQFRRTMQNIEYARSHLKSILNDSDYCRKWMSEGGRLYPLGNDGTSYRRAVAYHTFATRWVAQLIKNGFLPKKFLRADISYGMNELTHGTRMLGYSDDIHYHGYVIIGVGKVTALLCDTDYPHCVLVQKVGAVTTVQDFNPKDPQWDKLESVINMTGEELEKYVR